MWAASAAIVPASAGAAVTWRTLADGASPGNPVVRPAAYVALTRSGAAPFLSRLPSAGVAALDKVDFTTNVVVAIIGEFGCRDGRIAVSSIAQRGTTLAVNLVQRPLAPGTAECMAIFGTYRLLSVPRSALRRPYPAHATVTLAGS